MRTTTILPTQITKWDILTLAKELAKGRVSYIKFKSTAIAARQIGILSAESFTHLLKAIAIIARNRRNK